MKKIINYILDIIFPRFCVRCNKINYLICPQCYEKIEFSSLPLELTLKKIHLEKVIVMARFDFPISNLIKSLKYQGIIKVGEILGNMIFFTTNIPKVDFITYVPMHTKKKRKRGFNQTEIIAKTLSKQMKIPLINILRKNKHTEAQASIKNRAIRKKRLENTFSINTIKKNDKYYKWLKTLIKKKHITCLLIDDVVTTGTTLNECAKILKKIGVNKMIGLVVASG